MSALPDDAASSGFALGDLIYDASRRLLTGLGPNNLSLFAVPTTRGSVCAVLVDTEQRGDDEGFNCDRFLSDGVTLEISGDSGTWSASGLAADDVTGVEVIANAKQYSARLARNGFYVGGAVADACGAVTHFERVLVHREGGRTETIDIGDLGVAGVCEETQTRLISPASPG